MVQKRVLRPERSRQVPAQFSWIDQRLVRRTSCGRRHHAAGTNRSRPRDSFQLPGGGTITGGREGIGSMGAYGHSRKQPTGEMPLPVEKPRLGRRWRGDGERAPRQSVGAVKPGRHVRRRAVVDLHDPRPVVGSNQCLPAHQVSRILQDKWLRGFAVQGQMRDPPGVNTRWLQPQRGQGGLVHAVKARCHQRIGIHIHVVKVEKDGPAQPFGPFGPTSGLD